MNRLTLSDFKVTISLPVQWGEMDAANHVNNAVYMRWVESARLAYFVEMGMDTTFKGQEAGPILAYQDCKYIFPVTYPDTISVGVRTVQVEGDRFRMECGIFSEKHGRLVAIAKQVIVPYNFKDLQKTAMPEAWLLGIDRIEEG